ncbi:MAG: hypothetical protein HC888_11440, partial [Candidatus Competibacteraceae bacterium]|nr:hypothetical protein [Candidatus Competibacteraceae bacterium]
MGALATDIVRAPRQVDPDAEDTGATGESAESRLRTIEVELWDKVRSAENPDTVRLYLQFFRGGIFANAADSRVTFLNRLDSDRDGVADYAD